MLCFEGKCFALKIIFGPKDFFELTSSLQAVGLLQAFHPIKGLLENSCSSLGQEGQA